MSYPPPYWELVLSEQEDRILASSPLSAAVLLVSDPRTPSLLALSKAQRKGEAGLGAGDRLQQGGGISSCQVTHPQAWVGETMARTFMWPTAEAVG